MMVGELAEALIPFSGLGLKGKPCHLPPLSSASQEKCENSKVLDHHQKNKRHLWCHWHCSWTQWLFSTGHGKPQNSSSKLTHCDKYLPTVCPDKLTCWISMSGCLALVHYLLTWRCITQGLCQKEMKGRPPRGALWSPPCNLFNKTSDTQQMTRWKWHLWRYTAGNRLKLGRWIIRMSTVGPQCLGTDF